MKFFQYILIASLICIFFLQSGCSNEDKWKAVPLQIKKQKSFNYSEMISGDLDSSAKSDLEAVKKNTTEKMKNTSEDINNFLPPNRKDDSIWQGIKNTYNWFLDLF